ncbi:MAG: glutathione peroxidase [Polyangiaceae bacterium]|nr:glutathione peroxidase [Polyangiaceae bacterium]
MSDSIYDISLKTIDSREINLEEFKDKPLLIVNTASACGFTPQYEGLEALQKEYGDRGLVILGFPCNQFGKQEPGSEGEIVTFCQKNYGVTFQMFSKVDVNGSQTHPLFEKLKEAAPGLAGTKKIKWNFTKFLVAPGGETVTRFAPATKPEALREPIEKLL